MNGASAFVRVDGVSRVYGTRPALRNCSFELAPGDVLALVGPNGAGKSTLAKLLTGFLEVSSGSIEVGGLPPATYRTRFGVGYLPEDISSFGNRTLLDLLLIRESDSSSSLGRREIVECLGLDKVLRRRLGSLSHGQRRLSFLAYAMLGPSKLVVLDEPDTGLDPAALERFHALVALCATHASTVVILSHQLQETAMISDWFAIVNDGQLMGWFDRPTVERVGARRLYHEQAMHA